MSVLNQLRRRGLLAGRNAGFNTLVERLSGRVWSVVPSPNPTGSQYTSFNGGISCPTSTLCFAVGQSSGSGTNTLIEQFASGAWTIVAAPDIGRLNSLSCPTTTQCIAVGNAGIEQLALGRWEVMTDPSSGPLLGVECVKVMCVAVGTTTGGTPGATLVEQLSAGTWTISSSPNPAAATDSVLFGVSCITTGCFAAGFAQDSASNDSTLIERN